jgi:hypothetical protein
VPEFTVKDSGQRQSYASGMVRDLQDGKARFDFLIPVGVPYDHQFLTRCAIHMTKGAVKYGDRNWEVADSEKELGRFRQSALRHMQQWASDEMDEDHAAACVFNLIAYETTKWKIHQKRRAKLARPGRLRRWPRWHR